MILSRDEKIPYTNNKDGEYLLRLRHPARWHAQQSPQLREVRSLTVTGHEDPLIAEDNGADGLAVDSEGRVYVPTNLGVEVFGPRGNTSAWSDRDLGLQRNICGPAEPDVRRAGSQDAVYGRRQRRLQSANALAGLQRSRQVRCR